MEYADKVRHAPSIDHIVILIPHRVLLDLPAWLTSNFTILEGGKHADGATENKLIVFEDGTYLELIAFVEGIDPIQRREHWWGRKQEGTIIDWAYTLSEESEFVEVQERVKASKSGIEFADPVAGGRTRPDGTQLRWAVAFPEAAEDAPSQNEPDRGEAPFWCFDRTPRHLRVPHDLPGNAKHPNGAVGVAGLTVVLAGEKKFESLKNTYSAIHSHAVDNTPDASWEVRSPVLAHKKMARVSLQAIRGNTEGEGSIQLELFLRSGQEGVGREPIEGKLGDRWLQIGIVPVY
jgi:hypothetical protein